MRGEREPGEADDPGGVAGGQAGQPDGLASQSRRPLIARLQGFFKHSRVRQQQKAPSCRAVLSDLHRDCTLFALLLHNPPDELH